MFKRVIDFPLWRYQFSVSVTCVCVCLINVYSFFCRFWYKVFVISSYRKLIEFWIRCHIPLQLCAHFRCIRYNCWLRFCFLQSGLRAVAAARKPDTQPSAPHHTDNLKTKAPNTTGSNHLYNTLKLLMMGIMVPETCWASNKICNKNHLLHLVCCANVHAHNILPAKYWHTCSWFLRGDNWQKRMHSKSLRLALIGREGFLPQEWTMGTNWPPYNKPHLMNTDWT